MLQEDTLPWVGGVATTPPIFLGQGNQGTWGDAGVTFPFCEGFVGVIPQLLSNVLRKNPFRKIKPKRKSKYVFHALIFYIFNLSLFLMHFNIHFFSISDEFHYVKDLL